MCVLILQQLLSLYIYMCVLIYFSVFMCPHTCMMTVLCWIAAAAAAAAGGSAAAAVECVQVLYYHVYLLYWYQSTQADTRGAVCRYAVY